MVKDKVELFSVHDKTGKLIKMISFQADFDSENPQVNAAKFAYGNQYLITGGNDRVIRAWKLDVDKEKDIVTGVGSPKKFVSHTTPIQHLDITFDHELVASIGSEEEKRCLIHDFATGTLVNELTFSEQENSEHMSFRGCIFSLHRKYLYTLVSEEDKNSYVTQWDAKSGEFHNLTTVKVHQGLCKQF